MAKIAVTLKNARGSVKDASSIDEGLRILGDAYRLARVRAKEHKRMELYKKRYCQISQGS